MRAEIKKTKNGRMTVDGLVCIKHAMELLGYKSRSTVARQAESGNIRFCWVSFGTPSQIRLFFKADIMKLKTKLDRKRAR